MENNENFVSLMLIKLGAFTCIWTYTELYVLSTAEKKLFLASVVELHAGESLMWNTNSKF